MLVFLYQEGEACRSDTVSNAGGFAVVLVSFVLWLGCAFMGSENKHFESVFLSSASREFAARAPTSKLAIRVEITSRLFPCWIIAEDHGSPGHRCEDLIMKTFTIE